MTHESASSVLDVSSAMSLIEKSFITWVNRGTEWMFDVGTEEAKTVGDNAELESAGARFYPWIKELWM